MDQLAQYQEALAEFQRLDAQLLGISVDSVWSHQALMKELHLGYPLLADFEPKGAVAKAYGVYRDQEGVSERALFVVDPKGRIAWSEVTQVYVNPGIDGILTALERMDRRWS
jgi:peroxiredoxin